jgi:arsenate reductase
MAEITVYHNPKCGTSRGVLEILEQAGVPVDVVEYLRTPLSEAQLRALVSTIDVAPADLVRDDNRCKELGLDKADYTTVDAVVAVLLEHPELMQRPIAVKGKQVVLARPKEKIQALL